MIIKNKNKKYFYYKNKFHGLIINFNPSRYKNKNNKNSISILLKS